MTEPTVSAIIPTYNYGRYLAQAVWSALEQDQDVPGGVEVIVVDDGSTDDTPTVMAAFGDVAQVQYVRQANQREAAARNNGARRARGKYFAFLDPDDYWLPGKLAADVRRFEQPDRPALVYSRGLNVDEDGRKLGIRRLASPQGDVFWQLARESFTPMSTVAVRADAFREVGGFQKDRDLSGTADWELWLRLAARYPAGFTDHAATCIRVHHRNMSSDPAWMERAMLAGVRHALEDPVIARRVGRHSNRVRSHMCVTIALNAYGAGRRGRAARWLLRSVQIWPAQVADPRFLGAAARLASGAAGARQLVRRARQGPAMASRA